MRDIFSSHYVHQSSLLGLIRSSQRSAPSIPPFLLMVFSVRDCSKSLLTPIFSSPGQVSFSSRIHPHETVQSHDLLILTAQYFVMTADHSVLQGRYGFTLSAEVSPMRAPPPGSSSPTRACSLIKGIHCTPSVFPCNVCRNLHAGTRITNHICPTQAHAVPFPRYQSPL